MITESTQSPDFLRLLGHELRWKLVKILAQGDRRVQELVALLDQPQNLISYHLKLLRDGQLLAEHRSTADARDVYYSLDLDRLQSLYGAVGNALHPALAVAEMSQLTGRGQLPIHQSLRILFLCTENSARSQMAEGILRHLSHSQLGAFSAGTTPSRVHPDAVRTLAEIGIDIRQQRAKSVDEFEGQAFNYIITVCDRARENCPAFPGESQYIHWSLPDPVAVKGEAARFLAFEQTAQQLTRRIRYFLVQIGREREEPR